MIEEHAYVDFGKGGSLHVGWAITDDRFREISVERDERVSDG